MAWEGRKYKLDKSEGFDEYMKALGEWHSAASIESGAKFLIKKCVQVLQSEFRLLKHVISTFYWFFALKIKFKVKNLARLSEEANFRCISEAIKFLCVFF